MDPTQHHQVLRCAVIEECALIDGLTRITSTFLLGDHKARDEEGVGDQCTTEHPACFKVVARVWRRKLEELLAQIGREEDGSKGFSVLEVGGGAEGER
jgi:hypothetical protein